MNTAPASREDWLLLGEHHRRIRSPADSESMEAITASARYQPGDLEADADFYRIHFKSALARPEHLEVIIGRL